jgi:hypothetical protein
MATDGASRFRSGHSIRLVWEVPVEAELCAWRCVGAGTVGWLAFKALASAGVVAGSIRGEAYPGRDLYSDPGSTVCAVATREGV